MAVSEILLVKLGTHLAKFLFKAYLGEAGEFLGEDLAEVGKDKIEKLLDRRDASRVFERLGERIAMQLLPQFEDEARQELAVEAVAAEVDATLAGNISAEILLAKALDPARILSALRSARPLPRGQFSIAEEALYDKALSEAVRYLVEVAAKLPRFEKAAVAESLKRLSRVGELVEDTAHRVEHIEAWVTSQESNSASQRYEADYRLAVIRNLDYLELFGVDIQPESSHQALSVAYISLQLEAIYSPEQEVGESARAEIVLDSLATHGGRLLIRGEAGSGKSTMLRWTSIQASYGGTSSPMETLDQGGWRTKVPFLIRLRDCQQGTLPKPSEFPELIARELGTPPTEWVLSLLRAGRAVLMFDGVDEVPNSNRSKVGREIAAIVNTYPANYFLVSTRPLGAPEGWLADVGFKEARVNPMSGLDRSHFIDRWHKAVADELRSIGRKADDLLQWANDLKLQLPSNPNIARLATNPLLCAMICALHRDRHQKLPENQTELCEALCHMLLHRREREGGLNLSQFPESYRRLSYEQKRAIVQTLAHYMVLNEESSVPRPLAEEKVAEVLRFFRDHSEEEAQEILSSLVERSGMLREVRPGYLDFIHNTFKEFLAGERFADSGDAGLLADRVLDPTWQRVALFAMATKKHDFASIVISRILPEELGSDKEASEKARRKVFGSTHDRRLVALRCRAAALFVEPKLQEQLDEIARRMFPPSGMGDAEVLSTGGDAVVQYLTFNGGLLARQAAACVRALRLIGTPLAIAALERFMNDGRITVISELAEAMNPLLIPAVRYWVSSPNSLSPEMRSQISDLSPLSKDAKLEVLDLRATSLSDLSPLAGLALLRFLDISNTAVLNLGPLASLKALSTLLLSGTRASDFSPLAGLSSLKVLSVAGTKILDLSCLKDLRVITSLNISNTGIMDLAHLSPLISLERIALGSTNVSDALPLAGLTALQSVDLARTRVVDLAPISSLTSLKALRLRGAKIRDLTPISGLTNLEWFDCADTAVEDLSSLLNLRALRHLDVSLSRVTKIESLSTLKRLEILNLQGTKIVDISSISCLNALKYLNISKTMIVDLTPLVTLASLEELYIDASGVDDLSALLGLAGLRTLVLRGELKADVSVLLGLQGLRRVYIDSGDYQEFANLLRDIRPRFALQFGAPRGPFASGWVRQDWARM